ncbi:MAG: ATP-dependent Clp protease proteolytic subunit [Planctomycetota bacterium]|nr:ATP-dependent Clp protease proteolytic subunit [Planctomycetota bacterium]
MSSGLHPRGPDAELMKGKHMDNQVRIMGETMHPPLMGAYAQGPAPYQRYREMSIEDLLLENRIIFMAGPINDRTASLVIMRMLYLQSLKKDQDINLYINCPGGMVDQTLAIYDTMQHLTCGIATYSIGQAASGGAVILAAGTKGKRYALPNSKIMLHQPWGGITGAAEDIRIQAEEILRDKKAMNAILAKHSNMTAEKIEEETERDRFLDPKEAVEWGLVDEIVEPHVKPDEKKDKK